jgi:hypothetical protein
MKYMRLENELVVRMVANTGWVHRRKSCVTYES